MYYNNSSMRKVHLFKGHVAYVYWMDTLLGLSSWCLVIVVWLFLMAPLVCLWFVIVVFPDHTHVLFLCKIIYQQI